MAQIAKTSEQIGDRGPAVHSSVGSSTAGIQALPEGRLGGIQLKNYIKNYGGSENGTNRKNFRTNWR